jgi:hypothetical protein
MATLEEHVAKEIVRLKAEDLRKGKFPTDVTPGDLRAIATERKTVKETRARRDLPANVRCFQEAMA